MSNQAKWIRTSEAARRLGVTQRTVQRFVVAGLLPTRTRYDGGWYQLDAAGVDRLAAKRCRVFATRT